MKSHAMTRRMAFLTVVLCALMLCAVSAQAAAPEIRPMDVDRVSLYPIPGVQYNKLPAVDGKLDVEFDCEHSDWRMAVSSVGGSGWLNACFIVEPPAGAVYHASAWGEYASEAELFAELEDAYINDWTTDALFGEITYTETEQILSFTRRAPADPGKSAMFAVAWYDENQQLMFIEKADVTVDFSSARSLRVEPMLLPASMIRPNTEGLTGIEPVLRDGELTYIVHPGALLNQSSNDIRTELVLPDGTARIRKVDYFGNTKEYTVGSGPVGNVIYTSYVRNGELLSGSYGSHDSWIFLDGDGKVLLCGKLSLSRSNPADNRLFPAYTTRDWRVIPSSRFHPGFGEADALLKTVYKDGLLHIAANPSHVPTDESASLLAGAVKNYIIDVPNPAKSYRVARMGGPNMFGGWNADGDTQMMENDVLAYAALQQVNGSTINVFDRDFFSGEPLTPEEKALFWQASTSENGMNLYRVSAEYLAGRATVFAVQWFYDKAGEHLMYTEWFGETADQIVLKPKTVRYDDGDSLADHKNTPAYADLNGSGYTLYAEFRPQKGSNGYIITLELHDRNGHPVKNFDRNAFEFFIPYPVGNGPDRDYKYQLTHYFDDSLLQSEVVTAMIPEAHGIRFRLSSLSPIELTWEDVTPEAVPTPTPAPVPPADLPRTGDATPVGALLALMIGAAAVLAAASRRRSA